MQRKNQLRFEVERLKTGPITHELTLTAEELELVDDPEYQFNEPVTAQITAQLAGTTVLLMGHIATTAQAPCARCLENLRVPLRAELTLVYMDDERLKKPGSDFEDDNTFWYDGDCVYPTEQLRECLLLQLPSNTACELEGERHCPIRNVDLPPMVFGDDSPAEEEKDAPVDKADTSLAAQMRRLRDKLDGS